MRLSSGQSQRSDQGPNMLMSSVPQPCAEDTQKCGRRRTEGRPPRDGRSTGAGSQGGRAAPGALRPPCSPPANGRRARPSGQCLAPAGLVTAKLEPVLGDGGDTPRPCSPRAGSSAAAGLVSFIQINPAGSLLRE